MTFVLSNPSWDLYAFEQHHPNAGEYPYFQPPFRFVYVARERDGHRLKIGLTISLSQRLAALKAEPVLVFRTPYWDAHTIERHLHHAFKDDRLEGEWFHPSHRLVAFVEERLRTRATIEARGWRGICCGEVVG